MALRTNQGSRAQFNLHRQPSSHQLCATHMSKSQLKATIVFSIIQHDHCQQTVYSLSYNFLLHKFRGGWFPRQWCPAIVYCYPSKTNQTVRKMAKQQITGRADKPVCVMIKYKIKSSSMDKKSCQNTHFCISTILFKY